jgi:hypothetical protein
VEPLVAVRARVWGPDGGPGLPRGGTDLLADTVDGGASVGFLAPLDRAAALAWWKERVAGVAAGQFAVWAARDGQRVAGTVSPAFPDKPDSGDRAEPWSS